MRIGRTVSLLLVSLTCGCGGSYTTPTADPPGAYSTKFPLTENPISEGGKWINGGVVGLDWTNISTTPGLAIGHEGDIPFSDATAILAGMWKADQEAEATVYALSPTVSCGQEVELRLRTSIAAHSITGYEVSFSTAFGGLLIARWNGSLGDFDVLLNQSGMIAKNGDVVRATIVGNVISAYVNGVLVGQATDSTYASGSPGMGFNFVDGVAGCAGANADYGFTSFSALDSTQASF